MRAGTLRHQATAIVQTVTKSSVTGAPKKTNTIKGIFRFFRQTHKEQSALLGKEEATKGIIVMQCRRGPFTEAMTHFKYDGNLYRIEQKLPDELHNTYDITATLVNE